MVPVNIIINNNNSSSNLLEEVSPKSREFTLSGGDGILRDQFRPVESGDTEDFDDEEDDDDGDGDGDGNGDGEFDEVDSGAESDDFDLLELGETGSEFCRTGDFTCCVPFEIYDLSGLEDVLSVEVWNGVLSDEDRFGLTKYLPDMDQETFARTLKLIFEGQDLYFGSPMKRLFEILKGGLCEPRVSVYREGLISFQKRQYYHSLRERHNEMVSNWCQARDAWVGCKGYGIEEKLRVLNLARSQKSLMFENVEKEEEKMEMELSDDGFWWKNGRDTKAKVKVGKTPSHLGKYLEIPSQMPPVGIDAGKYRRQNLKGMHKLGAIKYPSNETLGRFNTVYGGPDVNYGHYGVAVPITEHNDRLEYDSVSAFRLRDRMRVEDDADNDDEVDDLVYRTRIQQEQNAARGILLGKSGFAKARKKHTGLRSNELGTEDTATHPFAFKNDVYAIGRNRMSDQLLEAKQFRANSPNMHPNEFSKHNLYSQSSLQFAVGGHINPVRDQFSHLPLRGTRADLLDHGESFWHAENQRQFPVDSSLEADYGRIKHKKSKARWEPPNHHYVASSPQLDDRILLSELRAKPSKKSSVFVHNGRLDKGGVKGKTVQVKYDDTDSDSSEPFDDGAGGDEGDNPLLSMKPAFFSGTMDVTHPFSSTSSLNADRNQFVTRDFQDNSRPGYLSKSKQKRKNSQLRGIPTESLSMYPDNVSLGPKKKREASREYHAMEENGSLGTQVLADNRSEASLLGCSSVTKKRKAKEDAMLIDGRNEDMEIVMQPSSPHLQVNESVPVKKGKRKSEADMGTINVKQSEPLRVEMKEEVTEMETKPQKKPYTPIQPTVHTGFTFSIVRLLSAVRMAMISPTPEGCSELAETTKEANNKEEETTNANKSDHDVAEVSVRSLTVEEIVGGVKSNPGDPHILEMQEPLQDLVRGVLKLFSSKTAPLGAKGWKPLVMYEKSTKSWSWTGPVSHLSGDQETVEEVTSPEHWGLTHKVLVKLVDSFANWLKSGQETLQKIGSLPAPPFSLMECNQDEKERFKDLRAQKSLITIKPSCEEVREYFRKEEALRYSVPDRAFSYTAADGKKSIVAPLRRSVGKPNSKARDHFMLKRDRPPHVTILCIVRDAAARLPGSIGTRADVCTLIRDSQYIVEDVTDAQLNQVVSGALDRLHYERDPCVQFDGERKLWVYLHREREEQDFEDDGTSSTKKWKRPKKESAAAAAAAADNSDQGVVTVAFDGNGDAKQDAVDGNDDTKQDAVDGNDDAKQDAEGKLTCQENFTSEDFDGETLETEVLPVE